MPTLSLYLMSRKGYEVLAALLAANMQSSIAELVYAWDAQVEEDYAEALRKLAQGAGLRCFERKKAPAPSGDYVLTVSWRWLIADVPEGQLIVLHDSLLPKYRGFAPLVNALINGERELGVTALFAQADYDVGSIIAQERIAVEYPLRIADAIERISALYVRLVLRIFESLRSGQELLAQPQNEAEASYSLWRDEQDYALDWSQDAARIARMVDAVSWPYKGACTWLNGKEKIRILEAEVFADLYIEIRDVGKLIFFRQGCPVVVCGQGLLLLRKVYWEESGEPVQNYPRFRLRFGPCN